MATRQEEMVFGDIKEGELQEAVVDGIRYAYATGETTASVIHDDSYQGLIVWKIRNNFLLLQRQNVVRVRETICFRSNISSWTFLTIMLRT